MNRIFLLVFTFHSAFSETIRVWKGETLEITSPDYPQPSLPTVPAVPIVWNLQTEVDHHIRLWCTDIRVSPSEGCELGYVEIKGVRREGKHCGSESLYLATSIGNELTIELNLKRAQGVFNCSIVGVESEGEVEKDKELPPAHPIQKVHIKQGDPAYDEFLYDQIPSNTERSWIFTTEENAKLSFACRTFGLNAGGRCHVFGSMNFTSGGKVEEFCNHVYDFEYMSSTNELRLDLRTISIKAKFDCIVQSVTGDYVHQYRNIGSFEIDSREHGGKAGPKRTNCECGTSNKPKSKSMQRIINGEKASENEFPFVVSLQHGGSHFCGGSILTAYHILTAAHCTAKKEAENIKVLAGKNYNKEPFTGGQLVQVKDVFDHEKYVPQDYFVNDISILLLAEKLVFDRNVKPICLPNPYYSYKLDHQYITAMGWGLAKEGNKYYIPSDLMKAKLKIVDYPTCNFIYNRAFTPKSKPNKICTWATDKDICSGDSGGPIVWLDPETNRYTQMGLVSFSYGCNIQFPTVYSSVSYYHKWVQTIISRTKTESTCMKI